MNVNQIQVAILQLVIHDAKCANGGPDCQDRRKHSVRIMSDKVADRALEMLNGSWK